MAVATATAANIGTKRIAGLPSRPPNTLDRNDVGSTVAAEMAVDGNSFVRKVSAALAGARAESDGSHVELCPVGRLETKLAGWTNAEEATKRAAITAKKRGDLRVIVLVTGCGWGGALGGMIRRVSLREEMKFQHGPSSNHKQHVIVWWRGP